MERSHQSIRTHDDGPLGKLIVALADPLEVVSGRVGLSDGPGSEVHDLVAIVAVSKETTRGQERGSRDGGDTGTNVMSV
jgi:hypothetical protein